MKSLFVIIFSVKISKPQIAQTPKNLHIAALNIDAADVYEQATVLEN